MQIYVQVSVTPLQYTKLNETTVSTMIIWRYQGHEVAIEGSWDDWKKRYGACDLFDTIT